MGSDSGHGECRARSLPVVTSAACKAMTVRRFLYIRLRVGREGEGIQSNDYKLLWRFFALAGVQGQANGIPGVTFEWIFSVFRPKNEAAQKGFFGITGR
jgi:hypothetical protein